MTKEPEAIQYCPKCNERYEFEKFYMLDEVPLDTRCRKCGFFLFLYTKFKFEAVNIIMATNSKELNKLSLNPKKLLHFLEDEVGLKKMN